jgi:hypothetical protein
MPVDAAPSVDGTLALIAGVSSDSVPTAATGALADFSGQPKHKSHFATCPQAGRWRNPKGT